MNRLLGVSFMFGVQAERCSGGFGQLYKSALVASWVLSTLGREV